MSLAKQNQNYKSARKACGECIGRITTDDVYSKLSLEDLLKVQQLGFVGLSYEEYYNAWTPGMSRKESNAKSGYFTHIFTHFGACVPTVVGDDWSGEVEPCSGDKEYGFYWLTAGKKSLEDYIAEAEAEQKQNAQETWDRLDLSDRVEKCQEANVCIFAARREVMPNDSDLVEVLNAD